MTKPGISITKAGSGLDMGHFGLSADSNWSCKVGDVVDKLHKTVCGLGIARRTIANDDEDRENFLSRIETVVREKGLVADKL
jgi:hypothetical protein